MTGLEPGEQGEAEIVTALCRNRGQTRAAKSLLAYAAKRTMPGPVRLEPGRSFVDETREELADAANYVPWAVAVGELDRATGEKVAGHLVAAWALLQGK